MRNRKQTKKDFPHSNPKGIQQVCRATKPLALETLAFTRHSELLQKRDNSNEELCLN